MERFVHFFFYYRAVQIKRGRGFKPVGKSTAVDTAKELVLSMGDLMFLYISSYISLLVQ